MVVNFALPTAFTESRFHSGIRARGSQQNRDRYREKADAD